MPALPPRLAMPRPCRTPALYTPCARQRLHATRHAMPAAASRQASRRACHLANWLQKPPTNPRPRQRDLPPLPESLPCPACAHHAAANSQPPHDDEQRCRAPAAGLPEPHPSPIAHLALPGPLPSSSHAYKSNAQASPASCTRSARRPPLPPTPPSR
jgi:hypothetical protein